jgi:hypothetical protein
MPRLMASGYTGLAFWTRRIAFLERCRARYGTPFTLWMRLPPVPMVWFDDPEHVKAIFQAPADVLHAGTGSYELEHFFGRTGLAYMEGDEHLARRKTVNRSTHGEELKRINEAMREIAARDGLRRQRLDFHAGQRAINRHRQHVAQLERGAADIDRLAGQHGSRHASLEQVDIRNMGERTGGDREIDAHGLVVDQR